MEQENNNQNNNQSNNQFYENLKQEKTDNSAHQTNSGQNQNSFQQSPYSPYQANQPRQQQMNYQNHQQQPYAPQNNRVQPQKMKQQNPITQASILALAFGLLALGLAIISFNLLTGIVVSVFSIGFAIAGLITAIIALKNYGKSALSLTGLISSILALILSVIVIVACASCGLLSRNIYNDFNNLKDNNIWEDNFDDWDW